MTGPVPGGPGTGVPDPIGAPATGASPTQPPATTPPAQLAVQGDPGLGDAGSRALQAERDARREAERRAEALTKVADLGAAEAVEAERRRWAEQQSILEARINELKPLAAKAQELEDAGKSEAQRLAEQAQTAAAEAATATKQLQQMQAALAAAPPGMDAATVANLAGRIQGATPEEMQVDAAALFQLTAGAQPAAAATTSPVGQTIPVEHLKPGALPTAPTQTLDEQIAAAVAAGDTATAMQLKSAKLAERRSKQPTT